MKKVATLYVGALVSLALGFGCASDPAPGTTTNQIVGGTPGATTTAGRSAAGASAAGSSAAAVPCGTKTCDNAVAKMAGAFASQIGTIFPGGKIATACCFDPATSTCSYTDGATGTMCLPPVVADTRCPAPSLMGVMATPCCKTDGNCGTDLSALSLACGTPPFGAPAPRRCDAPPGAVAGAPAVGAAGTTAAPAAGAGAVAGTTAAAGTGATAGATAAAGTGAGGGSATAGAGAAAGSTATAGTTGAAGARAGAGGI